MPKPENFDKLTPDQKRQARLEAWVNHEGLEFINPEAEKGYRERAQMFTDAFLMKKPKRVPVALATGFFPFLYAGYSCKDAMYDYEKLGKAMKKYHADFMPDIKALEAAMNPKTRALLINSPNNPSGQVYTRDVMTKIGELIRQKEAEFKRELYLISDDAYRKIVFDGLEVPYVFGFHPRSIMATSHSKDLALPGERIGYVAVNPRYQDHEELTNGIIFCSRVLGYVNAPALMQHVVEKLQDVTVDVGRYQRQRDFFCNALTEMGYQLVRPHGTFYIFPKTPIPDEMAFINELLKYNVLVVPGSGFGTPGYFRIAYCTDDKFIEGSLPGFKAVAKKYGLSK